MRVRPTCHLAGAAFRRALTTALSRRVAWASGPAVGPRRTWRSPDFRELGSHETACDTRIPSVVRVGSTVRFPESTPFPHQGSTKPLPRSFGTTNDQDPPGRLSEAIADLESVPPTGRAPSPELPGRSGPGLGRRVPTAPAPPLARCHPQANRSVRAAPAQSLGCVARSVRVAASMP